MSFQKVSRGLWIDDPPRTVLNAGYFRALKDCHIGTIAIMIDRCDKQWKTTWTEKQIEEVLRLADDDAVEVVITTWPYPIKQQLDEMYKGVERLMHVGPISAWEVDLEFNWKSTHVDGFYRSKKRGSLDIAGDYLVDRALDVCRAHDSRFEVTSFTQHTENGPKADVAPHCDRLLVQAYSVRKRPGMKQKVPFGHTYGPGTMQKFTLDRTLTIPGIEDGKPEIGCGLAAWSQRWPGVKPDRCMELAVKTALAYSVVDLRWWSSKHVIGIKKNPYAAKFLETLQ